MSLSHSEGWQIGVALTVLLLAFTLVRWYQRRKRDADEAHFWREVDRKYGIDKCQR